MKREREDEELEAQKRVTVLPYSAAGSAAVVGFPSTVVPEKPPRPQHPPGYRTRAEHFYAWQHWTTWGMQMCMRQSEELVYLRAIITLFRAWGETCITAALLDPPNGLIWKFWLDGLVSRMSGWDGLRCWQLRNGYDLHTLVENLRHTPALCWSEAELNLESHEFFVQTAYGLWLSKENDAPFAGTINSPHKLLAEVRSHYGRCGEVFPLVTPYPYNHEFKTIRWRHCDEEHGTATFSLK